MQLNRVGAQRGAPGVYISDTSALLERSADFSAAPRRVSFQRETRVEIDGKFLRVNGRRFWLKGVTYGTFAPNSDGEPYPEMEQVRRDFEQMRAAGINTVRLYTPPSNALADAAADAGLYIIADICWGMRNCDLDQEARIEQMRSWTREHARRLADHPAILMFSVGNEVPPLLCRWYGAKRIEALIRELYQIAKEEAPNCLVTYVNHPPTEYLDLSFLDVISWNLYLEREPDFRSYLGRLQMLAGHKPLFLAEVGLDSSGPGQEAQTAFLEWQIRAAFEKGVCGLAVYSWTDEWQIFESEITGWSFGLTDGQRRSKPALRAVRNAFSKRHAERALHRLPAVSVVVCAYNAAATLEQCLESLSRLAYPSYEVIVVDDGSTDATAAIAERSGFRLIRAPRGGLSRARNAGIDAATGSIVAFIDADAYADPDWLFFLVCSFDEQNAAAVGGPNLSPPHDGFIARCVNQAPGNPTHVLLDNERAEHIPGCNMAFRKSALAEIGGFDATHRAAGDDVDVCWKLLAREKTIAFAHAAIVWHHRRPTIATFLKQQRGYGYAESHLHHKYPGHYNLFGHAVWQGGVYDGLRQAVQRAEFPRFLRSRIYQGQFGSAQFQAIYPAIPHSYFQLFATIEWMAASVSLVATAGWMELSHYDLISVLFSLLGFACLLGTFTAAMLAGINAAWQEGWQGRNALCGTFVTAFLHLAQPVARAWGRFKGWRELRHKDHLYQSVQRLWGTMLQRDEWLKRFEQHLRRFGWQARPSCSFDRADLDVLGPGPLDFKIESVCEERLKEGHHYLRYRVTKIRTWKSYAYFALCAGGLVSAIACHAWPLLVPLFFFLLVLVYSETRLTRAIAQIGVEVGEGLGMPPIPNTWF